MGWRNIYEVNLTICGGQSQNDVWVSNLRRSNFRGNMMSSGSLSLLSPWDSWVRMSGDIWLQESGVQGRGLGCKHVLGNGSTRVTGEPRWHGLTSWGAQRR